MHLVPKFVSIENKVVFLRKKNQPYFLNRPNRYELHQRERTTWKETEHWAERTTYNDSIHGPKQTCGAWSVFTLKTFNKFFFSSHLAGCMTMGSRSQRLKDESTTQWNTIQWPRNNAKFTFSLRLFSRLQLIRNYWTEVRLFRVFEADSEHAVNTRVRVCKWTDSIEEMWRRKAIILHYMHYYGCQMPFIHIPPPTSISTSRLHTCRLSSG